MFRATSDTASAALETAPAATDAVFLDTLTSLATAQSSGSVVIKGKVTARGLHAHHLHDISVDRGALWFRKYPPTRNIANLRCVVDKEASRMCASV